jgi:hypothetical protein
MRAEEFVGEFETHLTVRLADERQLNPLQTWANARRMKCTHIVLDCGRTPSQPMLTLHAQGSLSSQKITAAALSAELHKAGFEVSRIKIEIPPWNPGVPGLDVDAKRQPPERYFEHHVRLVLESADVRWLVQLVQPHAAHVSRNALRHRDDGRHERFVTQRCYCVGRATAQSRLASLLAAINSKRLNVLEVDEEFVVYDSDQSIDAGWIEN